MEKVVLAAENRTGGRHESKSLRHTDQVPAVVYGPGIENQLVSVDTKALHKALVAAGAGLISLQVAGSQPLPVLVRGVQRNPIKHLPIHVDFMAVAMNELLRLTIPVVVEGSAPALQHSDLMMVRNMDSIEIECLPENIPQHIVADISGLETVDHSLYVRDLFAPDGVRIVAEPDQVVISITSTGMDMEEEVAEAAAEVEVVAKGKAKEEEAE